jgi:hypothetical protein
MLSRSLVKPARIRLFTVRASELVQGIPQPLSVQDVLDGLADLVPGGLGFAVVLVAARSGSGGTDPVDGAAALDDGNDQGVTVDGAETIVPAPTRTPWPTAAPPARY